MSTAEQHTTKYREEYAVPEYLVEEIRLTFQLHPEFTLVTADTIYAVNQQSTDCTGRLLLHGENMELVEVRLDGRRLEAGEYEVSDKELTLVPGKDRFELQVATRIDPVANTALEGLYCSNGNYCTQCEPEGFRRITYYPDRPDVLARFTTRIEADRQTCPVLLSNGNLVESGELGDDRHYAVWRDPFPKPCYLFALVAGRLVSIDDTFTTRSGRDIALRIFVEERNRDKCDHAMRSLKKAMKWDEDVYGLEYDLDIFMIVAVDDFNMGAMENKGLNIFNSRCVLASPESATDQDFVGIEGVVAHEYFHNWTGNRVTCRDWFQLSLKEGLTVFRDQEFSSDMNSRAVQRIDDVQLIRNFQFREDAGPMAHPVRPDSYVEINNFYTVTVYNKGAEIIRMMHTLLGAARFRKGMDLYFARHDGQAVTCDDFAAAMADASGIDLHQFKRWYSQAGTPVVKVSGQWLADERRYILSIRQSCPATPGQVGKEPFHIPLAVGLLDRRGQDMLSGEPDGTRVLELRDREQSFSFSDIAEKPVLSLLRGFSAPVKVEPDQTREELAFLLAHDTDLFNRWHAASKLSEIVIMETVARLQANEQPTLDPAFVAAVRMNLQRPASDKALLALALQLPAESYLAQQMDTVDPDNLHLGREFVGSQLASLLADEFRRIYDTNEDRGEYRITPEAMGQRSLKNVALAYLLARVPTDEESYALCCRQYAEAGNMTDAIAALSCITRIEGRQRQEILHHFYAKWQADPLVLDKWFTLQAVSPLADTLAEVTRLLANPSFSMKNPNKVRALIGAFCSGNHYRFHDISGAGYTFLADRIIELNATNPQIAARMLSPLTAWKRYDPVRQDLIRNQLERILAVNDLSGDVYEIAKKSLQAG
ncbi:MAG: aminopeptidase N [Desulfoprunum sp.]|jgi:aminopeptidase N|uniref:aminopeptidase N n=1 Tax=Desulfoprunum sp. TaxID=2020866 RepID=UPI000B2C8B10